MNLHFEKFKKIYSRHEVFLFIIPAIVFYVVFKYKPLYFLQIAFKDYRITRPIENSPWIGFQKFQELFSSSDFQQVFMNTIIINFYKLAVGFPLPILLALLLNELRSERFKRLSQSLLYLPHFISWSVLGGVLYNILSVDQGLVNSILNFFGIESIFFMGDPVYFRSVLVGSEVWRNLGWGTILYLAALTRVDTTLYEAAYVDGATRIQRLFYITIPGISSTIVVLFIIQTGHLLDVGFEQILVLGNVMVQDVADIIDTYVFRVGLQQGQHSLATAAGLFKTVIAGIMVFGADRLAKMLGHRGIL
ncbi:sugar ABC transporter permease [Paenibacillus sp. PAMC21692]|uniref:ABC transporter permease n=1 Tax=Paenibacillus sp. PAMC21692 TaxID=2762320 RepID=UPI00164E81FA|nr:ABC transporter permease subunit [Paenibacillus sp. PAMC21692]QNK55960.1 sugar ABC transporter permease [Paenibacillus sp. PAMC21692]